MVHIGNDWDELIGQEFSKEYYLKLREFLKQEYSHYRVYPAMYDIFNALKYTSFADTRAVIIGQDPYHEPGQAHGLCFSVKRGVTPPPSLVNIFKELHDDLGLPVPSSGELTPWARQGVLLLNTVLTVRQGQPASHKGMGWEIFTDAVIRKLSDERENLVFMLWGSYAKEKIALIDARKHLVLTAAHPSPRSADRGFFGCRHFSRANAFLWSKGIRVINW